MNLIFFMGGRRVGNMVCLKSHDSVVNSLIVMNIFLLNHDYKNIRENGKAFSLMAAANCFSQSVRIET